MRNSILCFVIYAAVLIGGNAAADKKTTVAVLSFNANNVLSSYGEIIRNQFEVCLYKTGAFTILEREQIDKVLKEQGLQLSGCADTSCVVEVGKLLSVDYVIVGSIDRMSKFMLSVKAVNISEGSIAFADSRSTEKEDDIPGILQSIADKIEADIESDKIGVKTDNITADYHYYYGWLSLGLGCFALGGAGTGIYFNNEVNKSNDRYDNMAERYAVTTDPVVVSRLKRGMQNEKEKRDENALYRNIAYGAAAASLAGSLYFLYRYVITKPEAANSVKTGEAEILPVFNYDYISQTGKGTFIGISLYAGF